MTEGKRIVETGLWFEWVTTYSEITYSFLKLDPYGVPERPKAKCLQTHPRDIMFASINYPLCLSCRMLNGPRRSRKFLFSIKGRRALPCKPKESDLPSSSYEFNF